MGKIPLSRRRVTEMEGKYLQGGGSVPRQCQGLGRLGRIPRIMAVTVTADIAKLAETGMAETIGRYPLPQGRQRIVKQTLQKRTAAENFTQIDHGEKSHIIHHYTKCVRSVNLYRFSAKGKWVWVAGARKSAETALLPDFLELRFIILNYTLFYLTKPLIILYFPENMVIPLR